jgi:ferredoxin-NADP reductase
VQLAGPKNLFRLDETADHYVLIAAGIGITPMLAMADRLQRAGQALCAALRRPQPRPDGPAAARVAARPWPSLILHVKDEGGRMHLPTVVAGVQARAPGVLPAAPTA